jgi:hypothetical protein
MDLSDLKNPVIREHMEWVIANSPVITDDSPPQPQEYWDAWEANYTAIENKYGIIRANGLIYIPLDKPELAEGLGPEFVRMGVPPVEPPERESYKRYLQSAHWKRVAARAKARANNRCQLCGAKERDLAQSLQVHHNNYENLGAELDSDLIALCRVCHGKYHNWGKK